MLELVDLKKRISKDAYQQTFPKLAISLGECQRSARKAGVPVVVVFEGWDAAGKGTIINRLTQALDPRGFKVHPISAPNEAERLRPWMWRFWTALPAAGRFAFFDRSWYGRVLVERLESLLIKRHWKQAYEDIREFERQLAESGTVIVKFWLHLSKEEQARRFKRLKKSRSTAWKVGKQEWGQHRTYDVWTKAVEEMLERTSTGQAPWTVIEATQGRYVRVRVFEAIIQAVKNRLERPAATGKTDPQPMASAGTSVAGQRMILDQLDLSLSLKRDDYEKQLDRLQKRLFQLEHEVYAARIPAVIVYEGVDAGGKGGNMKRLTQGLDPRGYEVIPTGPPEGEEKTHHYLWRFWRNIPKAGHITIFDRSWYGRVLVERVEGFCTEEEWKRAYREINEFERQLADFGTVIVKFWLYIDEDEQLRRFKARERTPHKKWKITQEDWRNRAKWSQYKVAAVDMLRGTSTTYAPWTILEANCKLFARVKALRTVAEALQRALKKK